MKTSHQLSFFVIGLALFAMFFGSGNLIFPLFVGQLAEGQWIPATFGFLLTAVLIPISGVIAMVVYKGDYSHFFSCLGKKTGFLVILALLTVWIPLGSGPRCATLAYASMLPYVDSPIPIWAFSLMYCAATAVVVFRKSRMLDILGYFLTPLLLICLALIFINGIDLSEVPDVSPYTSGEIFLRGLMEGYNTMDLIAAFFFSASIILILKKENTDERVSLTKTFKASMVGASLLGAVYIGLVCLAASHSELLQSVPKDQLLVFIAKSVLGSYLGFVASLAVFLACFTTSVALATVYSDFIADKIFQNTNMYPAGLLLTQVVTLGMSITGLQGITFVTEPMLQIFYPMLIVLIVFNVGRRWLFAKPTPIPENS